MRNEKISYNITYVENSILKQDSFQNLFSNFRIVIINLEQLSRLSSYSLICIFRRSLYFQSIDLDFQKEIIP